MSNNDINMSQPPRISDGVWPNRPQQVMPQPVPQVPQSPGHGARHVTLKRATLILLIAGIIAALVVGYIAGRLTIISRANSIIAQKNSRIEKLETSLDSVKKQLADANKRLNPTNGTNDDSNDAIQQGQIGETVVNGGIEMKLVSASEQATISYDTCGDSCSNGTYAPKSPDASTKYWVAVVEVKNNTKKPLDITCSYPYEIYALNSDSQQYTPIDALYQVEGNPECNVDLQPGLSTQVTYPFQVPLDVKMVAVAFRDVGDILSGTSGEDSPSYLIADKGYKISSK